jgi:hypothetical protein
MRHAVRVPRKHGEERAITVIIKLWRGAVGDAAQTLHCAMTWGLFHTRGIAAP